jgi:predicted O-methyltransferase YrrM
MRRVLVAHAPRERVQLLKKAASCTAVNKAVEIGVQNGEHALMISEYLSPGKLYLVDAWDKLPNEPKGSEHKKQTEELFKSQISSGTVEIIYEMSNIACSKFSDGVFDFIYIDGDHSYKETKQDLENWFPKLRHGGVIAGHDYIIKKNFGVIEAVDEFRDNNKDVIKNFNTFGTRRGAVTCWLIETKNKNGG